MAASKSDSNPEKKKPLQVMGDWIAPLIAFLVVVGILLALISVLLESVR